MVCPGITIGIPYLVPDLPTRSLLDGRRLHGRWRRDDVVWFAARSRRSAFAPGDHILRQMDESLFCLILGEPGEVRKKTAESVKHAFLLLGFMKVLP